MRSSSRATAKRSRTQSPLNSTTRGKPPQAATSPKKSQNLFPQLLHLATPALRFNQAALGRPRALGLAPAIFGNLRQAQLARGRRGGFQLGRQQTDCLGPVTGLGSRSAHPHGETRRQVAEGDRRGDLVDVLATRTARPAEDFFDFAWPPRVHPATFPPDGLGDKSGHRPAGPLPDGHPWSSGPDGAPGHMLGRPAAYDAFSV